MPWNPLKEKDWCLPGLGVKGNGYEISFLE
jgi:hypothetical protein